MEMTFALLADSAAIPPDGKLYVLGGGFSTMVFGELPARASFAVIGGFRFTTTDVATSHAVELRLVDAEGKLVVAPAMLQFQSGGVVPPAGQVISVPTVTFLQPTFSLPGAYTAEFWYEQKLLTAITLTVEERTVPAVGGRPN